MTNTIILRGILLAFAFVLGATFVCADDWPGWRGPRGDNHVTGFVAPQPGPRS